MEIDGGVRQISVAQQDLDRAQVGAGLQQVRRVRMAQRVRTDATIDAGGLRGTAHGVPDTFGRERLVGAPAMLLSGEEIGLRPHPPVVLASSPLAIGTDVS